MKPKTISHRVQEGSDPELWFRVFALDRRHVPATLLWSVHVGHSIRPPLPGVLVLLPFL